MFRRSLDLLNIGQCAGKTSTLLNFKYNNFFIRGNVIDSEDKYRERTKETQKFMQ